MFPSQGEISIAFSSEVEDSAGAFRSDHNLKNNPISCQERSIDKVRELTGDIRHIQIIYHPVVEAIIGVLDEDSFFRDPVLN